MDYKYIEQLLERYWACDTSVEEEQILRAFSGRKRYLLICFLIRTCSLTKTQRGK